MNEQPHEETVEENQSQVSPGESAPLNPFAQNTIDNFNPPTIQPDAPNFWKAARKAFLVGLAIYGISGLLLYAPLLLGTVHAGGEGAFWAPYLILAFLPAFIAAGFTFATLVALSFAGWRVSQAKRHSSPAPSLIHYHIVRNSIIGIILLVLPQAGMFLLISATNTNDTNPTQSLALLGVVGILTFFSTYAGYGFVVYSAYSAFKKRQQGAGSLLKGNAVSLVLAIIIVILSLGSMLSSQQFGDDSTKAQNISNISVEVNEYTSSHNGAPPNSLSVVPNSNTNSAIKLDFSQYEYKKIDEKSYQLCTTFSSELAGSGFSSPGNPDPSLGHGAGRQCYTFRVL